MKGSLLKSKLWISVYLTLISFPAVAYIGPGMGGGAIAAVIGLLSAFFLAIFGIIYYPIKRAIKNKKNKKSMNKPEE